MSKPAHAIVGLDHVVLRVADVPRAIAFYCDVLGCSVERELPELGLHQLRAGSAIIDLAGVDTPIGKAGGGPPAPDGKNLDHFCVRIEPFDEEALRAHLGAHGIEVSESGIRYGAEGNGPSIYIQDPDGNTVELKGPPV